MNELKRELSKLSGVDMFNPKYRDVFKKYFPEEKDAEEERANEVLGEETANEVEEIKDVVDETNEEDAKDNVEEKNEELAEDIDKAEDEREIDKIEEMKADNEEEKEDKAEEVEEESQEIAKDFDKDEDLFDARLELALIRGGVREDKINPAKRLIKYELRDTHDLDKVSEILKDYPEWLKSEKPMATKFGMSIDENGDDLTAEERRLKEMGINPRD